MKPSLSALRLLFAAGFVASSMGASGVTASAHGVAARTAVPLPASRLEFGLSNFDTTWMNSSGVPWRYRFQYLSSGVNTGTGWETWNSPLGQFAVNYMNASTTAPANYIPVFTYYELLQSLPSTGADEKSRDYNNLNTASTMAAYYGNFKLLMQKAGAYGSQVVVHVEPDFWAYMQQIANGGTASSVSASVKGSGFAEASAFPDTLAGFAAELKYLRDTYAPNVALAMHASMWSSGFDLATNTDPTLNPVAEADKTAAFLNSAGGNTWDALFNDLDDHNAAWWELVGGNPYHWWDPNNVNFPNFSRYLSWVGELHTKTAVPQVAWQVPEGNQYFLTLNNTCGHYQDNVAPYFISHPGDLFNAGLIAVLFGPGNACQTNYDDTQADGITNNNGVPTTDLLGGCNACNTQTSTVSDDDGGYLRIFVGRYYAGQGTCFDVRLSASPGSPQASGAPVSINAAAAGCPHPLYQFWTLAPGATSWQVAQPYSTTASLPWQTTGLSPGTYQVAVWAKDSTSNGAYGNAFGRWDAFNSLPYTLVSPICTALHLSAAPPSPAGVGSPVVFTANGTCPDANPVYQFWTLAPGATSWTNVQPYSTTNTFSWSTVGKTPAGYQVAVWVRDASSPGAYSNVLGTFDLSSSIAYGLTTCASAGLSAMPGTTAGVGTPVNFTATAAGCPSPSPMYQFWVLAPGASGWTVAQPYSTSNTFGWSTAGKAPGSYQVAVWVRDASSAGAYSNILGTFDLSTAVSYALTSCTGASLSTMPGSSSGVGSGVTLTATAIGCPNPNPQFEFWVLAPGASSWAVVQPYSTSNTFSWITAGKVPGGYQVAVWVRDASSAGAYSNSLGTFDVSTSRSYALTTCSGAGLSAMPASASVGATVTVTASAVGCPNPSPQYQFWLLTPGASSWTLVQPYSTSSTFSWSTTGKAPGTYLVAVWVRDANSGGAYANILGTFDVSVARSYSLT